MADVIFARHEHRWRRTTGGRIRIAVTGVIPSLIARGELEARRQAGEPEEIGSRRQT